MSFKSLLKCPSTFVDWYARVREIDSQSQWRFHLFFTLKLKILRASKSFCWIFISRFWSGGIKHLGSLFEHRRQSQCWRTFVKCSSGIWSQSQLRQVVAWWTYCLLVVRQTKAVALQHFTIWHPSVANVYLASLRVNIVVGTNLELILFRHVLQRQFPDPHWLIFTKHDFLAAQDARSWPSFYGGQVNSNAVLPFLPHDFLL
jgi:hypothetical protein